MSVSNAEDVQVLMVRRGLAPFTRLSFSALNEDTSAVRYVLLRQKGSPGTVHLVELDPIDRVINLRRVLPNGKLGANLIARVTLNVVAGDEPLYAPGDLVDPMDPAKKEGNPKRHQLGWFIAGIKSSVPLGLRTLEEVLAHVAIGNLCSKMTFQTGFVVSPHFLKGNYYLTRNGQVFSASLEQGTSAPILTEMFVSDPRFVDTLYLKTPPSNINPCTVLSKASKRTKSIGPFDFIFRTDEPMSVSEIRDRLGLPGRHGTRAKKPPAAW